MFVYHFSILFLIRHGTANFVVLWCNDNKALFYSILSSYMRWKHFTSLPPEGVTRPPQQRPTVFQNKEDAGKVQCSERERQTATKAKTWWPYNTARVKKTSIGFRTFIFSVSQMGHEEQKIPQLLAAQK